MLEFKEIQELKPNSELLEFIKNYTYTTKNEKVNYLIDMIKEMDKNNKLKLAIRINESSYTPINYNGKEMLKYFFNELAEIDDEYKKFPVINSKYINFVMEKIMKMNITERNQVALFLFNGI